MLTIIRYRLLIAMIMSPLTTLTQGNIAQCFPEATLAELFMKPLGGFDSPKLATLVVGFNDLVSIPGSQVTI